METKEVFKETEFDSSVATLRRIDLIIMEMHRASVNPTLKEKLRFLNLLDCLYVEAQCKFTKQEHEDNKNLQDEIGNLKKKWGDYLLKNSNHNYYLAWNELWSKTKEYQIFVMRCLDKHNMLMRDQKDGLSRFRGM